MLKTMEIMPAPSFMDMAFMVFMPNRSKGPEAVAPYFFNTQKEAEDFIESQPKRKFWWNKED